MKVACLQFAPKVGECAHNIAKAEEVLAHADIDRLDILVLPELAFTGKTSTLLVSRSFMTNLHLI